jgi:hypothetical protein
MWTSGVVAPLLGLLVNTDHAQEPWRDEVVFTQAPCA